MATSRFSLCLCLLTLLKLPAALPAQEATIPITTAITLSNSLTVPSGVTLRFWRGGKVILAPNVVLTIEGGIEAGPWQIFTYSSSSKVILKSGFITTLYPQWWGANDTVSIERAINAAIASGAELLFPPGKYNLTRAISAAVPARSSLRIRGIGPVLITSTVSEPAKVGGALTFSGATESTLAIENIRFEHSATKMGFLHGIHIDRGFERVTLVDLDVSRFSSAGLWLHHISGARLENCNATDNRYAGLIFVSCENVQVHGGDYSYNGTTAPADGYGIACASTSSSNARPNRNILVQGVQANMNKREGLDIRNGHSITLSNNFVRGFGYVGIYAVNRSPTSDTKDVRIVGNHVDGSGSFFTASAAIEVGGYGDSATESGAFLIRGNTIRNMVTSASSAIVVLTPSGNGIPPGRVLICDNSIEIGSASNGYVILVKDGGTPATRIADVLIQGNSLHAKSALVGIDVRDAKRATINGNQITVESGNVTAGIHARADRGTIIGNIIGGGAQFSVSIDARISRKAVTGNVVN